MQTENNSIRVVKRYGKITGKEMFKVKEDPNGWCATVGEAVNQYHRCKEYWGNYHSSKGKEDAIHHSKKRK